MTHPQPYMTVGQWIKQARWLHRHGYLTRKQVQEIKQFLTETTSPCPKDTPLWHSLNLVHLLTVMPANNLPI